MAHPTTLKTYASRIPLHTNPTARRILSIMDRKRTNLCVSVDVTKAAEVLEVVRRVGASVCMVKVRLYTGGGAGEGQREETVGEGLGFWLTVLSAWLGIYPDALRYY